MLNLYLNNYYPTVQPQEKDNPRSQDEWHAYYKNTHNTHINSLNNKYKQIGWYSWIYIYDVVTISYDCNTSVRTTDSNEHRTRRSLHQPRPTTRSVDADFQPQHWLSIKMRISFQICKYMCMCVHGLSPDYLNCAIVRNTPIFTFRSARDEIDACREMVGVDENN